MPPKKGRSNNKKKGGGRSAVITDTKAAASCGQCARYIEKSDRIECICARVVYCSTSCQALALDGQGRHMCEGPPSRRIDLSQKLREMNPEASTFQHRSDKEQWTAEFRATILHPCLEFRRKKGGLRAMAADMSAEEYSKYADLGDAPCAYMAGINYKNRLVGAFKVDQGSFVLDNSNGKQISIIETDRLAFKYLVQASEAGLGIAMQSLADCYQNGQGCQKSMPLCCSWLWRSVLLNTVTAYTTLESKSLLILEHEAQLMNTGHFVQRARQGEYTHYKMGGPNLSALLLSLSPSILRHNYTLPPFAAAVPTCTVGNCPSEGTTGIVKIMGVEMMQEVMAASNQIRNCGSELSYTYGRRGTAKEATAQTYGEASRSLDNEIYSVPPAPACDDTPSDVQVSAWKKMASLSPSLSVHCIHMERAKEQEPRPVCRDCIEPALIRLAAVGRGSVVLSVDEALSHHGLTAIYRHKDGSLKSETFKQYGRGEVECALAALVAANDDFRGTHGHPIFVAQDPNLFWPLIRSHGSIRAALEYVAPHVDWDDRLYCGAGGGGGAIVIKPVPEQRPLVVGSNPRDTLHKCGSDICLNLEPCQQDVTGKFNYCARCLRRAYCCQGCQKADWPLHKRECTAAAAGGKAQEPKKSKKGTPNQRRETEPAVGEEVVVRSLAARPEFNGRLGVINGSEVEGRYPVKLQNYSPALGLKASNFFRLGIEIFEKKSCKQFKCSLHGLEICSECCLDFASANHLSILGGPVPREMIELIAQSHFSSIKHDDSSYREGKLIEGFPLECQGLKNEDSRCLLKALLLLETTKQQEAKSLAVTATIAGMACYSCRSCIVSRPSAVPHLGTLVEVLNA